MILEWSNIDLWRIGALPQAILPMRTAAEMHVNSVKGGKTARHPIQGDELRALRKLQREPGSGKWVFMSERGGQMTADNVNRLVKRLGDGTNLLGFTLHVHQLRHACRFALANKGYDTRLIQDWLRHKSISSTTRYTELSARRFKDVRF